MDLLSAIHLDWHHLTGHFFLALYQLDLTFRNIYIYLCNVTYGGCKLTCKGGRLWVSAVCILVLFVLSIAQCLCSYRPHFLFRQTLRVLCQVVTCQLVRSVLVPAGEENKKGSYLQLWTKTTSSCRITAVIYIFFF